MIFWQPVSTKQGAEAYQINFWNYKIIRMETKFFPVVLTGSAPGSEANFSNNPCRDYARMPSLKTRCC
jgi:hypothetical protein